MKIYGYTGARDIIGTEPLIAPLMAELDADAYVTGGCTGLDTYAGMTLARRYPDAEHWVIVPGLHPLVSFWWLTPEFASTVTTYEMRRGTTFKARNQQIVKISTELYAFPGYPEHHPMSTRSGTWQTVRMARRKPIPVTTKILAKVPA